MSQNLADSSENESEALLNALNARIEQNSHDIAARFERARVYFVLKQYQAALDDLHTVIALNRKSVEAWVLRAENFAFLKDYDSAFVNYDVALKLDLRRAPTYWSRARLHEYLAFSTAQGRENHAYREKQGRAALSDYTMALKLDPANRSYIRARARLSKELGEYEQALADYSRWFELEPGNFSILSDRAEICARLGYNEQAIADYTVLLNQRGNTFLYQKRGLLYRAIGEYQLALRDLNYALQLEPPTPLDRLFLHQTRADILQTLGYKKKTIAELKQIAAIEEELYGSSAVTLAKIRKLEQNTGTGPIISLV